METKLLNKNQLQIAANLLKQGEIVGFPTETVYGLGVVYNNEAAFEKLMVAKNRPSNKPFTLMCSSLEMIEKFVDINNKMKMFIARFMPGPLTLVLKAKVDLPHYVTMGSEYVGVRISSHPLVLELIRLIDIPLLVPSANKSGEESLSTYKEVYKVFKNEIAGLIKEDALNDLPSTIVKIEGNQLICIREGSLLMSEIEEYWRKL
jgi:L-threonylcarbamoyladenylate synthase